MKLRRIREDMPSREAVGLTERMNPGQQWGMALLHLTGLALLVLAVPALGGQAPGPTITGTGNPASECFVTLNGLTATNGKNRVDCTDGDPSCDVDGEANGVCTFYVRVCVAQSLPGCQATTITFVKATPRKAGLALPPVPATEPVCGDQTTLSVPLTKKGATGRLSLVLIAKNNGKPRREKDQIKIACMPSGSETSTTTTLLPPITIVVTTTSTTIVPGSEVLENGDFTRPVLSSPENGWSFANVMSGGWHQTGGDPGGYYTLNGAGLLGTDPTLSQQVNVFPGTLFRLTGTYRSFSPGSGDPNKPDAFAVMVVPAPLNQPSVVLVLPRPSPDPLAWTPFSVNFVPSSPSTTVSFVAERGGDDSSFDLDNLTLSRVQ